MAIMFQYGHRQMAAIQKKKPCGSLYGHRVEAAIFEDKSMAPYQAGLDRMGEPPQVYYVTEDGLVVGAYGEDLSFIFTVEGLELVGVRHAEDTTFSLIS